MRCTTRRPLIADSEALKLSSLLSKMTTIMRHNSLLVAIVKSVVNFSAASEKKLGVFFLAAWMRNIVENMILSKFLSENNPQTL